MKGAVECGGKAGTPGPVSRESAAQRKYFQDLPFPKTSFGRRVAKLLSSPVLLVPSSPNFRTYSYHYVSFSDTN